MHVMDSISISLIVGTITFIVVRVWIEINYYNCEGRD